MTDIRDQARLLKPMTAEQRAAAREAYLQESAISFPLTADDDVLLFTLSDLIALEKTHGTTFENLERKILSADTEVIRDCILLALKRPASLSGFAPVEIDPEVMEIPHVEAIKPILNALCMRYFAKPHDELIAETEAKVEAMRAAMANGEPS